ncbi:MAG: CoA pyrophosphatase [Xanthomonadales bacterium]|nr:CoA pyrophosphatase [Xanthomonadales bacterium]
MMDLCAPEHWQDRLMQAVSPLELGVKGLRISGFHPSGEAVFRPGRTAAVLVPFLKGHEPCIVLTRRADHLPNHPGQVSFPGGEAEEGDTSAVETALREAWEEIGLAPESVRPIGFLDRMDTISDYRVLPVVALVTPPVRWVLDETEVADVFTVPLHVALDKARYQSRNVRRGGQSQTLYTLHWKGQNIWGATAAILMNLISRMENPS